MVYGTEAVLPSDVTFGSPRVKNFDQSSADIARELEINCMEEKHLNSCLRTAKYLEAIRRYHNRNVKDRSFVVGDLVLKWKTSQEGTHKLSTPWEGPVVVTKVTRPTSYRLAYPDGTRVGVPRLPVRDDKLFKKVKGLDLGVWHSSPLLRALT